MKSEREFDNTVEVCDSFKHKHSTLKPWKSLTRLPQSTLEAIEFDARNLPQYSDDCCQRVLPSNLSSWRFFDIKSEKLRWAEWYSRQEKLRCVSQAVVFIACSHCTGLYISCISSSTYLLQCLFYYCLQCYSKYSIIAALRCSYFVIYSFLSF